MCKRYGFPTESKCYKNVPEIVLEDDSTKILWDFSIQTNHKVEQNKPDIITVDKETKKYHMIDGACPPNTQVNETEHKKAGQYQELKKEQ